MGALIVLTLKIALLLVFFHCTLRVGYALGDRREQAYVGSGVAEGKNSVGVLILICVGVS
jgi:hypothetical protein